MSWQTQLRGDSISWLLESENPGVRYLAMRDLLELNSSWAMILVLARAQA